MFDIVWVHSCPGCILLVMRLVPIPSILTLIIIVPITIGSYRIIRAVRIHILLIVHLRHVHILIANKLLLRQLLKLIVLVIWIHWHTKSQKIQIFKNLIKKPWNLGCKCQAHLVVKIHRADFEYGHQKFEHFQVIIVVVVDFWASGHPD